MKSYPRTTIVVTALVALTVVLWLVSRSRPEAIPVTNSRPADAAEIKADRAAPPAESAMAVDVAGSHAPPPKVVTPSVPNRSVAASEPPATSSVSAQPSVAAGMTPERELAATYRMYAAHAPLRAPEVASPTSATNQAILQTMVTKALSTPPTNPPGRTASN